jgi:hypothetical protein
MVKAAVIVSLIITRHETRCRIRMDWMTAEAVATYRNSLTREGGVYILIRQIDLSTQYRKNEDPWFQ